LTIWAERIGVQIVKHKSGADPAAVAYDACQAAVARNADSERRSLIRTQGRW
jgi:fused signal recognition particle receptor